MDEYTEVDYYLDNPHRTNVVAMGHSINYRLERALSDFKKRRIDGFELYQIVSELGFSGYTIDGEGKMTVHY